MIKIKKYKSKLSKSAHSFKKPHLKPVIFFYFQNNPLNTIQILKCILKFPDEALRTRASYRRKAEEEERQIDRGRTAEIGPRRANEPGISKS